MNKKGKIIMFLSSYSPLYILIITFNYNLNEIGNSILALNNYHNISQKDIFLYILFILIILPNIFLKIILNNSKKYSETIKIKSISNGDEKILDYILAYIVTFMTTNYVDLKTANSNILITGVLIQVLLGYLYCRGNMLYINPVLNILYKYHIFIATTERKDIIILSRKEDKIYNIKKELIGNEKKSIKLNYFSKDIYILN